MQVCKAQNVGHDMLQIPPPLADALKCFVVIATPKDC